MDRKKFIKTSSAASIGLSIVPFSILKDQDDRKVRLGFIGTGSRGTGHLRGLVNGLDVEVPSICDIDTENAAQAQKMVQDAGKGTPELYTNGPKDYLHMAYGRAG